MYGITMYGITMDENRENGKHNSTGDFVNGGIKMFDFARNKQPDKPKCNSLSSGEGHK